MQTPCFGCNIWNNSWIFFLDLYVCIIKNIFLYFNRIYINGQWANLVLLLKSISQMLRCFVLSSAWNSMLNDYLQTLSELRKKATNYNSHQFTLTMHANCSVLHSNISWNLLKWLDHSTVRQFVDQTNEKLKQFLFEKFLVIFARQKLPQN